MEGWKKICMGKFKNDIIHGKGTFTYPDGTKYVGEYKDGKRHGQGTLTYADGKVYIGEFVAGYEHGKGTCFNKDGSSTECEKNISSAGKDTHDISFVAKKKVKLSEYDSSSGKAKKTIDELENNFKNNASELCLSAGSYNILEKKIEILEIDEKPAFGTEPVVKLGISGVVECK